MRSTYARTLGYAAASTVALGAGITVGAWVEARAFQVKHVVARVLPEGMEPFNILHLSDAHLVPRQYLKRRFIASLEALEPDVVINTGDNIGSADAIEPLIESFGSLLDCPGAFVLGSNDLYAPTFRNPASYLYGNSVPQEESEELPWTLLVDEFVSRGWVNAENASGVIEIPSGRIEIRGTADAHRSADDYDSVKGPIGQDIQLALGVTHAPYRHILDAMVIDGMDMIFAGHTHGGQICLPGGRALVNNCDLPLGKTSGLSAWRAQSKRALLHVSGGIGTSPKVPLRLFCRPSVTLVHMVEARV